MRQLGRGGALDQIVEGAHRLQWIGPCHQHVLEIAGPGAHRRRQNPMIEAAKRPRHDERAGARLAHDELHLRLPVNRQDRRSDGAERVERDGE